MSFVEIGNVIMLAGQEWWVTAVDGEFVALENIRTGEENWIFAGRISMPSAGLQSPALNLAL